MLTPVITFLGFVAVVTASCPCGVRPGTPTPIKDNAYLSGSNFPWMAYLEGPDEHRRCSGFIINDRWIVSARSCLLKTVDEEGEDSVKGAKYDEKDTTNIKVWLGQQCKKNATESKAYSVKRIVRPKASGLFKKKTDIILVELNEKVNLQEFPPLCLGFSGSHEGRNLFKVGYGSGTGLERCLTFSSVSETQNSDCKKQHSWFAPSSAVKCSKSSGQMCVEDYGSPTMLIKDGQVYAQGVNAWMSKDLPNNKGVALSSFPGCLGLGQAFVTEQMEYHYQWIQEVTKGAEWCSNNYFSK